VLVLSSEVKETCRESERGAREARALISKSQAKFALDNQLPSNFFLKLVKDMEDKLSEFEVRTEELKLAISSASGGEESRVKKLQEQMDQDQIVDIIEKQFQAFKAVAESATAIHNEVESIRKEYTERYVKLHGEVPRDFDIEEKMEKDRQRRLHKKVENLLAGSLSGPNNQGQQQNQQVLGQQQMQQTFPQQSTPGAVGTQGFSAPSFGESSQPTSFNTAFATPIPAFRSASTPMTPLVTQFSDAVATPGNQPSSKKRNNRN